MGDSTVFRMAAICHLGFVKFKFCNGQRGYEAHFASSHQFRKDRSNHCDFCDFQYGGRRHLGFSKFDILTVSLL